MRQHTITITIGWDGWASQGQWDDKVLVALRSLQFNTTTQYTITITMTTTTKQVKRYSKVTIGYTHTWYLYILYYVFVYLHIFVFVSYIYVSCGPEQSIWTTWPGSWPHFGLIVLWWSLARPPPQFQMYKCNLHKYTNTKIQVTQIHKHANSSAQRSECTNVTCARNYCGIYPPWWNTFQIIYVRIRILNPVI